MVELKTAAHEFVRSLDAVAKAAEQYLAAASAAGDAAPDGATARGLDGRQIRKRLKCELVARLSPRPVHGLPDPVFELEGAPQARRFAAANPLPGLS